MIEAERRAIESTYDGVCSVYVMITQKVDGETRAERSCILEMHPCALSKVKADSTTQGIIASAAYTAKLFISPEVRIPEGSKVIVSQYGMTYELEQTGIPVVYPTHQEILLRKEVNA